jgi:predicted nuclease of restriction endonuclease-like RecB superfamily
LLTSDLVRVRRKGELVIPRFLSDKDRERLLPVAERFVALHRRAVGGRRAELDEALDAVAVGARDRALALGLRKLCDDRLEVRAPSGLDPERVREAVFARAAAAHQALARGPFDRAAALALAAADLGVSPSELDDALYADLDEAQIVASFEELTGAELLDRYDLALAQALLLRATRVRLTVREASPAQVRALLRAARFHGLLFVARAVALGTTIEVDGPFSLFDAVQRYGLKLAIFLPHVLALPRFAFEADLVLGKERKPARLELDETAGLRPTRVRPEGIRPEIEQLLSAVAALGTPWKVRASERLVTLDDGTIAVPDAEFEHEATGEVVLLELMGFWSRDAVWRRIEQLERAKKPRMILAVSESLRVSESALDPEATGSALLTFKTTLSARALVAKLDGAPTASPARAATAKKSHKSP